MSGPVRLRLLSSLTALVVILLVASVVPASATHFRYGTMSWEKLEHSNANEYKVRVTIDTGWRWTYSHAIVQSVGSWSCPSPLVSDPGSNGCPKVGTIVNMFGGDTGFIIFNRSAKVTVVDGYGYPASMQTVAQTGSPAPWTEPGPDRVQANAKVIAAIPQLDVMYTRMVFDVVYAKNANPITITYTAENRLSTLKDGNADRPFRLMTTIDANPPNTKSAHSASLPVLKVTANTDNSLLIPFVTYDNTTARLTFSNPGQSSLDSPSPPGLTIDTTIPNKINWHPTTSGANPPNELGLYAVQFMLQSVSGGQVKSQVPLDLLFSVEAPCPACPNVNVTTPGSTSLQATVGSQFTADVDVHATPFTNGSTLSLANTPFPLGMEMDTAAATVNPMRGTLRWTPTATSQEDNVVCFQGGYTPPNSSVLTATSSMLCLTIHVDNPFDLRPVVTCDAASITVPAASPSGAVVTLGATVAEPEHEATSVTFTEESTLLGSSSTPAGATSTPVVLSNKLFPIGTHDVVVTASDGSKVGSCTTQVVVSKRPQTVTITSSLASLKVGLPRPLTATAQSGLAPVTFSVPPGSPSQIVIIGTTPNLIARSVPFVEVTATQAGDGLWDVGTTTVQIDTFDGTPPFISVPPNAVAEATGPTGAIVNYITAIQQPPQPPPPGAPPIPPSLPFASDDIDGLVPVTCSHASGATFPLAVTTVSCTATDAAGNVAPARTFTVTVRDTTAPSIEPHADVPAEATSAAGASVSYVSPATADIVDGPGTASCSVASGETFAIGTTAVTCNKSDAAGNAAAPTTFNVIVRDNTKPVIEAHADVTAEATSAAGASVSYVSPATSDAVDGNGTATCSPAAGETFPIGTTAVTCNKSDASGNAAAPTTFNVNVRDNTKPVIEAHADVTAEATSAAGASVSYVSPATSDAVDGNGTATCSPAAGETFPIGTTAVTCRKSDGVGNAAEPTSFNIIVRDSTRPLIEAHADVTAEATSAAGAIVSYVSPATSDGVDGNGMAACSPASGGSFAIGATVVTCTKSDSAGNAADPISFGVIVKDTTKPVIAAHADVTAEATSAAGAIVSYTSPATSDVIDGSGAASCAPASGGAFAIGATQVTCTRSDAAGNAADPTTFSVVVGDSTAPAIDAHADVQAQATSPAGAVVVYTSPASHDAVGGDGTASCSPASGSTFGAGTTTVTCTKADAAGNIGTRRFNVIVTTNTAPTFTPPANITVNAANASGAVVTFTANGSDIEQGTIAAVCTPASGSTFAIGATTVNCTVTDVGGLSASGSFTVTVVVTNGSVQGAVTEFLGTGNEANGLITKLNQAASAPNANARAGQLNAFINQVNAKIGKTLTAAEAAALIQMVQSLF